MPSLLTFLITFLCASSVSAASSCKHDRCYKAVADHPSSAKKHCKHVLSTHTVTVPAFVTTSTITVKSTQTEAMGACLSPTTTTVTVSKRDALLAESKSTSKSKSKSASKSKSKSTSKSTSKSAFKTKTKSKSKSTAKPTAKSTSTHSSFASSYCKPSAFSSVCSCLFGKDAPTVTKTTGMPGAPTKTRYTTTTSISFTVLSNSCPPVTKTKTA